MLGELAAPNPAVVPGLLIAGPEKNEMPAAASGEALLPCLCELPPALRQALPLDNGSEMAGFRSWSGQTSCISFCRPHSPWQRGTNENEGGLLRQYFSRSISLHKITEKVLRNAAERLNKRPRKCLNYQTPAEVF